MSTMTVMTDRDSEPHAIQVRKPDLSFDGTIPRHWLAANPIATQMFNGLNLVFPEGERFFIQAVRDHLDAVEDPKLRAEIRGFFGQEARHAHEHERYFEILGEQGYRVEGFLRRFHRFRLFTTRWLPARLRLAMTVGAEHYTAVLGHFALGDDLLDDAHPTMRRLILWHAIEEIEHKSVAFDVLEATHPGYALRIAGFALATAILLGWSVAGTRMLLRQDGLGRAERRQWRARLRERGADPGPEILRGLAAFFRRDFHPSQIDDLGLAHRRLSEIGYSSAS